MKDFNFDKMKNYNVSDEWADRVLLTTSTMKPSSNRYAKIVVSCLCLTFACVISLMVFSFGKNTQENIKTAIKSETTAATEIKATDTTTHEVSENPTSSEKLNEKETDALEKPTVTGATDTQVNKPVKPTSVPATQPQPEVKPTAPQSTTPVVTPTIAPTEPATQAPTEDTTSPAHSGDCIVSFSPSYLVGNGTIYCRIKDADNNSVGDTNLFSQEHVASFYSGFGSVYYYLYSPQSAGVVLEPGTYKYFFYNEHGVPILNIVVEIQ